LLLWILSMKPLLTLAACCLGLASFVDTVEARVWKDKAGKVQVEADLSDFADGKIAVTTADGQTRSLPLHSLTEEQSPFGKEAGIPALAEEHYNLGSLDLEDGRYTRAVGHFKAALRFRPKYPEALTNRGIAYDLLDDYEKSVADYTAALAID